MNISSEFVKLKLLQKSMAKTSNKIIEKICNLKNILQMEAKIGLAQKMDKALKCIYQIELLERLTEAKLEETKDLLGDS